MDAVWYGIKVGVGIAIGACLVYFVCALYRWIRECYNTLRFIRAGFTWEPGRGWLSRDPTNDDWMLWDDRSHRMLRASDDPYTEWTVSAESIKECLKLGRAYKKHMRL